VRFAFARRAPGLAAWKTDLLDCAVGTLTTPAADDAVT
jgi:hypothetical protein